MKNKLLEDVWSKQEYYECAEKGSFAFNHPGMQMINKYSQNAIHVLDMGCGEGTRLNHIVKVGQIGIGVDLSKSAVALAKKKFRQLNFTVSDLENMLYEDDKFDFIYSAFVFEHLNNPELVIKEGMRVLKKGGYFAVLCPNYGAPNRCSPPYKGNRLIKFFFGFISDFVSNNNLNWHKVTPIATKLKYEIDWDTTVEPYLGSFIKYAKHLNLEVVDYSSCWSEDLTNVSLTQKIFRFLGKRGVYPFSLWGPHMIIVVRK